MVRVTRSTEKQRVAKNIATVYNIDFIMKKIVSNLTDFSDRIPLERVSRKFGRWVRETEWPAHYDTLKMQSERDSALYLSFGSFQKRVESKTRYSSMLIYLRDNMEQSSDLMNHLRKLLIAKKNVKSVFIGGEKRRKKCYYRWNHENILITKDMLEHLENFTNLKCLYIEGTVWNRDCADYIKSEECQFKHRLTSLIITGMLKSTWMTYLINENLKHLKIRNLEIPTGAIYLQRLRDANINLESVELEIINCDDVAGAKTMIEGFSARCNELIITLRTYLTAAGECFLNVVLSINAYINIKSLVLDNCVQFHSFETTEFFWKLTRFVNLETLSIKEHMTKDYIDTLKSGISHLPKLKHFELLNQSIGPESGKIKELLEVLPLKIRDLKLGSICLDSDSLNVLCKRLAPNLETLTIQGIMENSCPSHDIFFELTNQLRSLKELHFFCTIPCHSVKYIIDLPLIEKASISIAKKFPRYVETFLRSHFVEVQKTEYIPFVTLTMSIKQPSKKQLRDRIITKWEELVCEKFTNTFEYP